VNRQLVRTIFCPYSIFIMMQQMFKNEIGGVMKKTRNMKRCVKWIDSSELCGNKPLASEFVNQ
jgi:hypothetical protein